MASTYITNEGQASRTAPDGLWSKPDDPGSPTLASGLLLLLLLLLSGQQLRVNAILA